MYIRKLGEREEERKDEEAIPPNPLANVLSFSPPSSATL
jgi:hypothetical protein